MLVFHMVSYGQTRDIVSTCLTLNLFGSPGGPSTPIGILLNETRFDNSTFFQNRLSWASFMGSSLPCNDLHCLLVLNPLIGHSIGHQYRLTYAEKSPDIGSFYCLGSRNRPFQKNRVLYRTISVHGWDPKVGESAAAIERGEPEVVGSRDVFLRTVEVNYLKVMGPVRGVHLHPFRVWVAPPLDLDLRLAGIGDVAIPRPSDELISWLQDQLSNQQRIVPTSGASHPGRESRHGASSNYRS